MFNYLKSFCAQDDGAVTVDWVVLTASIVGLSVAVIALVFNGATDQSTGVGAVLSTRDILSH